MRYAIKLQIVSAGFAFALFAALELMMNVYRIGRWTGWEIDTVNRTLLWIYIGGFFLSSFLFPLILLRWLEGRWANFWSLLLWMPYFLLFAYTFAEGFPITDPGEYPNPIAGLIAIGAFVLYPIYLGLLNLAANAVRTFS
ncbi:hypothetical protein [Cohnella nanjingensis]|uniref:Uncharacterized protein n=1 Tax=Cohnella nanjingensis TaxID=1387779 RepID=A0A7X0VGX1_9BACL|nr:hypothetical protein [Cohnella nanjingensis]MBB6673316.1 hypothetical protein [Cohnella nanjingensis]